ncbi:MAG: excinuclease ABC subunit UvrA [Acidobacteriales bacterium]|nr:excinuclease ABC subunit UvrA [Terriglobales bacterium]
MHFSASCGDAAPIKDGTGSSRLNSQESIVVRGARVHNLKNIDVSIPHNALTVVTGVSGSGKSSLAFDTVYAEGQRRYVESLSAYARQFLERIEKPDVDSIDGIAPGIAIRQKNTTRNPRSTVATATEIYDYLRLLFARIGTTYCLNCGQEVRKDPIDQVAAAVLAMEGGARLNLLFPVVAAPAPEERSERPKKRTSAKARQAAAEAALSASTERLRSRLGDLRKRGFSRLYQNGRIFEFSTPESLLDLDFAQPVFVLVDRIVVSPDARSRIVDGAEICYREVGEAIFETVPREASETSRQFRFSQRFECKTCRIKYEDPEPRLFSFNNPFGACPRCQGFGNTIDFDLDLVIPDKTRTLDQGAIEPWTKPKYRALYADLKKNARALGVPLDLPWSDLTRAQQDVVLDGDKSVRFPGIKGFFAYLERKKYKLHVRVFLSRYRGYATCPECKGQRLRAEARTIRILGKNICDVTAMTVEGSREFFEAIQLTREQTDIADKVLLEIRDRLRFLDEVGLDYLTLDRLSSTLSGGEAQRIQLATSLASRLVGAMYVLDEPSIGLHTRDTERLIRILHGLRDLGNTILVVEHDPEVMQAADHILDLGPGAGEHGGRVVGVGTLEQIRHLPQSLTGRYLSQELRIQLPAARRAPSLHRLKLFGARANNLKRVAVEVPLGMLVAVTGVSGSGKSTLVHEVLYKALASSLGINAGGNPLGTYDRMDGVKYLNDAVLVDQSPIGRTPRSNPVTYIKAFDAIRELFASTPEAHKHGFAAGHFSFNIPGGRCEACAGDGTVTVEMQFLADVELICEDCKGARFKPEVLAVRHKGKNVHEVLDLTVKESLQFFSGYTKITDKLRVLEEVGLGYLRLGQSATTLSGGEAQRMKLAAHLQPRRELAASNGEHAQAADKAKRSDRTLYIFDEPTTGLHFDDVSKLLFAFRRLLDRGASILVIEHNLDVIKNADWIIDLGPEGGDKGGEIVAVGPPEDIMRNARSHTGKWLARALGRAAATNGGLRIKSR